MEKEEEVTFCQDFLPNISFVAFEEMRKKGELCDLTLNIQDSTIVAHRVVLAAAIPYFRSLFTKDADQMEDRELVVANLDPNSLESLIHFAYSSKLTITKKNVHSLLLTADALQLTAVTEACVGFLSDRLHIFSVLEVCTLSHNINNRKLAGICNSYMQQNFEEFSKSEDFLSLPFQCVKDVISQDELNVPDEETVFEAVINWVKISPSERQDVLPDLLREVRMATFPTSYLIKRVATEELVRSSTACKDLVQDVQSFHLLPENERSFFNLKVAPRKNKNQEIYAVCNTASNGYSVYRCDFANDRWHKLKSDKSHSDQIFRVVASEQYIYVFLENTIKTFHLKTQRWEALDSTHSGITGSAVLNHGTIIYCIGSLNVSYYDKVRRFDMRQGKWLGENNVENGRANVAATSEKDAIYVTGGYWKSNLFNTAEKYIPSTGQWCQLPPMLSRRSLHGSASIDGRIYVYGGCEKNEPISSNSGEMFNPVTSLWNRISAMKTGRQIFSCCVHSKIIYVFGGETGFFNSTLQVELYDPECDEWKSSFSVPEGFASAVMMMS